MFQLKTGKHYEAELSKKYGIPRKEVKKIISYFFIRLIDSFLKGHKIIIPFFGMISTKRKQNQDARN